MGAGLRQCSGKPVEYDSGFTEKSWGQHVRQIQCYVLIPGQRRLVQIRRIGLPDVGEFVGIQRRIAGHKRRPRA